MAIVPADWTITRSSGDIRYIGNDHAGGSPSYATVIEFHRFLQDLADDAVSSGDDQLDITDNDPSARSTDNIITLLGNYNIDDEAAEHLYDGSIIQGSDANVDQTIYDGVVNFGNSDVQIQIIQNGAVLADDWWNFGGSGLNANAAAGISHRFMIKTRELSVDIDGRRLIGTTRQFNKTYSEFSINGTARGNNVLALSNSDDLNNQTNIITVSGLTISNNNEGYIGIDVDNNGSPEFYYSEWNIGTPGNSINDFYEYGKYLTTDRSNPDVSGSTSTLYGLDGELFRGITHQIPVSGASGTFVEPELVSWSSGTGQLLAIDNVATPDTMWIQLLTGTVPSLGIQLSGASGALVEVDGSLISRSVSNPFVGQSTGSAIIGSYGLGIRTDDLTNSDTLFDLTNTSVTPPNNVNFTVGGLVSGQDRVLVAPWDGISLDPEGNPAIYESQLRLDTALTTNPVTQVVITGATVPSDTPASGTIRVVDNDGFDRLLEFSGYTNNIFELVAPGDQPEPGQEDFTTVNANAGNNVYVTYIDVLATSTSQTFTAVYDTDRDLIVLVRDGGGTPIKQFITSATFSSSDTTVTAIRTSDL